MNTKISIQTLRRLPMYLNLLKGKSQSTNQFVSAKSISSELNLGEIQVRKDLACVSDKGKPKVGYLLSDIISDIENALGYHDANNAVLVGAGKLGRALLSYQGFKDYGLNIIAAFDKNPEAFGDDPSGVKILSIDKMADLCQRLKIHIGIITVPAKGAQAICDALVLGGITAIWNFAPTHLRAPEEILVQNENMAASLAILSQHLSEKNNSK